MRALQLALSFSTLGVVAFVIGCGGSSPQPPNSSQVAVSVTPPAPIPVTPIAPVTSSDFTPLSETVVSADGVNTGSSAYQIIEDAFGAGSIEAPDFYSTDHNDVVHILEAQDAIVGNHFVFLAHRDLDFDRGVSGDRQRNEIKTFDRSDVNLQAFEGETFQYVWKFKVSASQSLSSRFTHFFQIKARNYSAESQDNVNGNDSQPVITLSGATRSSTGDMLQVRYSAGNNPDGSRDSDTYLKEIDWFSVTDEWLDMFVQITFAEADEGGAFKMLATRMSDNQLMIDIDEENIDMWRGQIAEDFSRPKWGIYRSILETNSLRSDEEQVRFADFTIRKGTLAD